MTTAVTTVRAVPSQAKAKADVRAPCPGTPASEACPPRIVMVIHITSCQKNENKLMAKYTPMMGAEFPVPRLLNPTIARGIMSESANSMISPAVM